MTQETEYSPAYYVAKASVKALEAKFADKLAVNPDLDRSLISFQGNKSEPIFRWFHYREGFSKQLVEYVLDKVDVPEKGHILDPFAGTGASPFVGAQYRSMTGYAVELLPVGAFFMRCRNVFAGLSNETLISYAERALKSREEWLRTEPEWRFNHLRITAHAFSDETESELCRYKTWANNQQDANYSLFLDFVTFSILEKISYTRKDGQYLRWDYRSPRYLNSKRPTKFDKGRIWGFFEALEDKLHHMIEDLKHDMFSDASARNGKINVIQGSVLNEIEQIPDDLLDCVITSPPYCNRYDYTRTYALELAYLGVSEGDIRELRQTLLTCTVENKPKQFEWLDEEIHQVARDAFNNQKALQDAIAFLEAEKQAKQLNNNGIVTMVSGYFYDTAVHLAQVVRKMVQGGYYVMVNDNVRYNGLDLPIDCILSDIAEAVGFETEAIWVLPKGKGNSSQQMKKHGRSELRKCVYVWRKK
ncbi:hypothetical protein MT369_19745 [Vibrio parahaemolyticus]|uniref:hypothetical protein n=1 Tax=Vibrio parahaemolyticus TaxID=670 RepID=UPI001D3A4CAB|nr:hypothetical protein [Vibrio parahaemolyticus]EHR5465776.1 hypothetical protein [Vibrio parahaemolyticus]MDL2004477.1 hypothetical protein [Vibrio parahaemolyticus]HCG8201458.1 hypothetical protein [Vibrio parahaemolyticus]